MFKKLTNLFLTFTLLAFVLFPFTVFANDQQEAIVATPSSHSVQAFKNMSDELKQVCKESFGPLWFAKPLSLAIITAEGLFKNLPVGIYNDIVSYFHQAENEQ